MLNELKKKAGEIRINLAKSTMVIGGFFICIFTLILINAEFEWDVLGAYIFPGCMFMFGLVNLILAYSDVPISNATSIYEAMDDETKMLVEDDFRHAQNFGPFYVGGKYTYYAWNFKSYIIENDKIIWADIDMEVVNTQNHRSHIYHLTVYTIDKQKYVFKKVKLKDCYELYQAFHKMPKKILLTTCKNDFIEKYSELLANDLDTFLEIPYAKPEYNQYHYGYDYIPYDPLGWNAEIRMLPGFDISIPMYYEKADK